MISRTVYVFSLILIAFTASGQNLDPTVEVSREYEGKLMEVHKPQLEMAVPDSVLRFELDFDYSVMDKPYRGAYEFRPYSVEMKPSMSLGDPTTFYLRAGAGYQLHPVFDMVWSPKFKKPFRMNAYASHNSFVGDYWTGGKPWFGYDFMTDAGVDGRYDWTSAVLSFDVFYNGIQQKDRYYGKRSYYNVGGKAGLASKKLGSGVKYKIDLEYRFGEDMVKESAEPYLRENDLDLDIALGYGLASGHEAMLDVGVDYAFADGAVKASGSDMDLYPHYVMNIGNWRLDLGVRFSAAGMANPATGIYSHKEQFVYPELRFEFRAVPAAMMLYLDISGDSRVTSYSDFIGFNRHANFLYGTAPAILDIEDETLNVCLGVEGRVGYRFSYGVRGGYVNYGNALLDGVTDFPEGLMPVLGYTAYEKTFVAADWLFDFESVKIDASLEYVHSWSKVLKRDSGLLLPAAFTGNVSVSYNWKKRIEVGTDCEFSTGRSTAKLDIPGYADLGLNAEYKLNRKFALWARGGNLLGMTIHRSPLFTEKWPYFTVGITLDL